CSDNPESNNSTLKSKDITPVKQSKTIALVMKTLTNPFFIEMERGARRAEKELGINLRVKTAAQETSIQQQIGIVNELIQANVDAIVIAPGDSIELIPVLKKAQDVGIVVVNIDNRLDPAYSKSTGLQGVPFISVDNQQSAYLSAKTLVDKFNQPTSVGILEGIREASNAQERKKGAIRAFNENPQIKIVAMETGQWKIDEGYEVTKAMFTQHPEIKALFCANDMMALGAIKYLQSSGKTDVFVAAYDALEQAKQAIRDGTMVATVDQRAAEQGYQGIAYANRLLKGEETPLVTLIDTIILTKQNVN
ncbi:MAG: sugar ABC transporter substrate-binding protein, partial [Gammaproteobacteria bacterium]|nr:sugar ABC transporter substrate-binding protein [Gammaproteobacteria bacterium]